MRMHLFLVLLLKSLLGDQRMKLNFPRRPPASPVVIVAIDDNTFGNTRLQWPWPRTYFAQMVDRLAAGGAKVIAFDVFFSEPEDAGKPAPYTVQGETGA